MVNRGGIMTWKQYNSHYEVSEYGDVKNIHTGKLLKPHLTSDGYLRCTLRYGKTNNQLVHRLVAMLFLDLNTDCKRTVNHKDCNKMNNHYSNLEWATDKDNINHAIRNGLMTNSRVALKKHNDDSKKGVVGYNNTFAITFGSVTEAIKTYGTVVSDCLNGRCNTAKGLKWSYIDD